jgi:hypothetical protein
MPTRVMATRASTPRRSQQHVSYAQGHDSILGASMASSLDSSSMVALANTTVGGHSILEGSYLGGDASVLHEYGSQGDLHGSGRDYSAAKQALATISAALSPMSAAPGNASRQAPGGMSRLSGRDQYSVPPPDSAKGHTGMNPLNMSASASYSRERMASATRADLGSKRPRESFAPEPSPLLASDRRSGGSDVRTRPAQRRKISQPTNTVKKIMDILKDTSTSQTEAR